MIEGLVIKLDRGYPLVRGADGAEYRCKHATALVKGEKVRAVIGDRVVLDLPAAHDKAILAEILPRTTSFVRKDPTERALSQVLAANFDYVLIAEPIDAVNLRRLERELVLAHETGAQVGIVLTKADLVTDEDRLEEVLGAVRDLAGEDRVLVVSAEEAAGIEELRVLIAPKVIAVLIGKSGVGKSSLVNMLVGHEVQQTATVRAADGKGRHTTVSREMIDVPGGGRIVDMPGMRGLGLWDADTGIGTAFADIEEIAQRCRFRDCRHVAEPGCAVCLAAERGELAQSRLDSYRALCAETEAVRERREEAARIRSRTGHPRRRG